MCDFWGFCGLGNHSILELCPQPPKVSDSTIQRHNWEALFLKSRMTLLVLWLSAHWTTCLMMELPKTKLRIYLFNLQSPLSYWQITLVLFARKHEMGVYDTSLHIGNSTTDFQESSQLSRGSCLHYSPSPSPLPSATPSSFLKTYCGH